MIMGFGQIYNTKYSKMPIFYKFEENCRKNKIGELEHPNQKKIAMHIIYQYQFTQLFLVRAAKNFTSLRKIVHDMILVVVLQLIFNIAIGTLDCNFKFK